MFPATFCPSVCWNVSSNMLLETCCLWMRKVLFLGNMLPTSLHVLVFLNSSTYTGQHVACFRSNVLPSVMGINSKLQWIFHQLPLSINEDSWEKHYNHEQIYSSFELFLSIALPGTSIFRLFSYLDEESTLLEEPSWWSDYWDVPWQLSLFGRLCCSFILCLGNSAKKILSSLVADSLQEQAV